jgi:hypothetical protein
MKIGADGVGLDAAIALHADRLARTCTNIGCGVDGRQPG